jgi:DNA-binding XRE family transcriptional regulator
MVSLVDPPISVPALADYERGARRSPWNGCSNCAGCWMSRSVLCSPTLGAELLGPGGTSSPGPGITVDVRDLVSIAVARLRPVQRSAAAVLSANRGTEVTLTTPALVAMAARCDLAVDILVNFLVNQGKDRRAALNDDKHHADRADERPATVNWAVLDAFVATAMNYLRTIRIESAMRQVDVARHIGVEPSALCRMEYGKRPVSVSTLLAIGAALKVNPATVLNQAINEVTRPDRTRVGECSR